MAPNAKPDVDLPHLTGTFSGSPADSHYLPCVLRSGAQNPGRPQGNQEKLVSALSTRIVTCRMTDRGCMVPMRQLHSRGGNTSICRRSAGLTAIVPRPRSVYAA